MAARGDQGNGGIYSDDFQNATLGSWWDTTNTPGTSSITIDGAGTANAVCRFTVPTDQDYLGTVWMEQDAGIVDESFVWEVMLSAPPLASEIGQSFVMGVHEVTRGTNHCEIVLYTGGNLELEYKYNGSTVSPVTLGAAVTTLGLRLAFDHEAGGVNLDNMTPHYNVNGGGWVAVGGSTGIDMTVDATRISAGRFDPGAQLALDLDWSWDTSAAVVPEDGIGAAARRVMVR